MLEGIEAAGPARDGVSVRATFDKLGAEQKSRITFPLEEVVVVSWAAQREEVPRTTRTLRRDA